MNLRVGQVLYVVLNKQTAIYPIRVIEEITKKTLEGVIIDYVLRTGGTDPQTLQLNEIDGEIFETADAAKTELTRRVVNMIQKRVDGAVQRAKEWYPDSFEFHPEPTQLPVHRESHLTTQMIDMGDGTFARMNVKFDNE